MQHSPPPHDRLFVPTAAGAWRGGRLPGSMIVSGAIALMIGSCLPWQVVTQRMPAPMPTPPSIGIAVLRGVGMVTLVLGVVTLMAGFAILKTPTHPWRLVAALSSLVAAGIGGRYGWEVLQKITRIIRVPMGHPLPVYALGMGLYVLGFGVLLIMTGVVLQRPAR
jgi:hypothetical protein